MSKRTYTQTSEGIECSECHTIKGPVFQGYVMEDGPNGPQARWEVEAWKESHEHYHQQVEEWVDLYLTWHPDFGNPEQRP